MVHVASKRLHYRLQVRLVNVRCNLRLANDSNGTIPREIFSPVCGSSADQEETQAFVSALSIPLESFLL